MADDLAKIQRIARVAQAFTPGAPIDDFALFAGRWTQVQDVISAVVQKGQHVALYGERGVGKTSLANVLSDIFKADDLPQFTSVKVNCSTDDTFASLWKNIFRELGGAIDHSLLSPEDVRYHLAGLDPPALIVVDELDRLEDDDSLTLLSDAVKTLSDHTVPSTLVLVGVAQSIGDLIGEHESIARALVKVAVPRMTREELREILDKGSEPAGVTFTDPAAEQIVALSRGLPHFTHLLALHAGQRVVADDRTNVEIDDVIRAVPGAVERHVVEGDYMRATHSPHSDNLYPQVLLACALAPQDQFGFFTAGAIRDPLEIIARRRLDIPAFARHLNHFLQPDRGSVLYRTGSPRRYLYRFRDPLLQTYVILNALANPDMISEEQASRLEIGVTTPDEPIEPEQLF
jgi:energy-coupling factor transporter ATP-binding protein EcfA2